jgi:Histidine kinase-, DNA gyrase B-, and HSP90-like ATPase
MKTINAGFKAKAHLLRLLGDELIGDDRLAIFELVKNSYDADANEVNVCLSLNASTPYISISDNGIGMDLDDLTNKWLELATNSKRLNKKPSNKYSRLPLGEKGVGRLAVHKLGRFLTMVTKKEDGTIYSIELDWHSLIDDGYLDETSVEINELNKSEHFSKKRFGTFIKIHGLYNEDWSRGQVRGLNHLLISLISPTDEISDFKVNLTVPGHESWIRDMYSSEDILNHSLWEYAFKIKPDGSYSWSYAFRPPEKFRSLKKDKSKSKDARLSLISSDENVGKIKILPGDWLDGIGEIKGKFHFYIKERTVLNASGAFKQIDKYLTEQSGIRVYRDGIRVFNYGEGNDDWLGLNTKRINSPSKVLGTNSIVGGIKLKIKDSADLKEKTNREGFDDNNGFKRLKIIVGSAFEHFFMLHQRDRESVHDYVKGKRQLDKPSKEQVFEDSFISIRSELKKNNANKKIIGQLDYVHDEYNKMREITASSGMAGLNLSVIFHEVEREIDMLHSAIGKNESIESLEKRSTKLVSLLEGFGPLLRKSSSSNFSLIELTSHFRKLVGSRYNHHKVALSLRGDIDTQLYGPSGLILNCLMNLSDNALFWSEYRAERDGNIPGVGVFILPDYFEEGPSIVFADTGPGFEISDDDAVTPFIGRRAGGMGLGLYYVNMVMSSIGGKILFLEQGDLELDGMSSYDGAVVALLFPKAKK